MANSNIWRKIVGLVNGALKFGFTGPQVSKDGTDATKLNVRANDGSSDAKIDAATTITKIVDLTATDGKKTTVTMATGAAADLAFTLPNTEGNAGEILTTDGAGGVSWSSAGGAEQSSTRKYTLNFNTASPLNLYNMPAGAEIDKIIIKVKTAFDATGPTLDIGIAGDTAKFVAAADVDLGNLGTYEIDVDIEQVGTAQMIATFNAGTGGTVGQAKIIVHSSIPV